MISQELREVMERIERYGPNWEYSYYEESEIWGIDFNKQTAEGTLDCAIRIKLRGEEVDRGCVSIYVGFAQYIYPPQKNMNGGQVVGERVTVFYREYSGAEYVWVEKKSFWSGAHKGGEERLIKYPSEECQYLKAYSEVIAKDIADKRNKEREQNEQECKKIFFGK